MKNISSYHQHDVLCGRGGRVRIDILLTSCEVIGKKAGAISNNVT
jgi:hypothetical protein